MVASLQAQSCKDERVVWKADREAHDQCSALLRAVGASTTGWTTLRRVIRFLGGGGGGGGALSHAVGGGVSVYLGGSLCVEKLKKVQVAIYLIRTYIYYGRRHDPPEGSSCLLASDS